MPWIGILFVIVVFITLLSHCLQRAWTTLLHLFYHSGIYNGMCWIISVLPMDRNMQNRKYFFLISFLQLSRMKIIENNAFLQYIAIRMVYCGTRIVSFCIAIYCYTVVFLWMHVYVWCDKSHVGLSLWQPINQAIYLSWWLILISVLLLCIINQLQKMKWLVLWSDSMASIHIHSITSWYICISYVPVYLIVIPNHNGLVNHKAVHQNITCLLDTLKSLY